MKVAGHTGEVRAIDSRYVILKGSEGHTILVPSYKVYTDTVIVMSKGQK